MSDLSASTCGGRRQQDPRKRVNYTTGLVLGEDEFVQDQTHLRERDHLGVRALHGYGTIAGLGVRWDDETGQLRVAPGLAVDPAGRLVCVPTEQCADLAAWLTEHREAIAEAAEVEEGELPDDLTLYVVLCYRECETDTVPVPSESCRSADESMAASRVLESFELRLRLAPPGPAGEVAGDALHDAVERLLQIAAEQDEDGVVDTDALRRELVDWATDERPEVPDHPCLAAPEDDCGERTDEPSAAVLLARVELGLTVAGEGHLAPSDPEVEDEERPVLLSTRFLQEWLTGLVSHPELFAPGDHSLLENLDADDHPQYLLADGSRPLTGTLNAGRNVILNLRRSNGRTHAMRRDEIVGFDLAPDPDDGVDGLRIVSLQGETLEASGDHAPNAGDVLRYDGSRWVPDRMSIPDPVEPDPAGGGEQTAGGLRSVLPLVTVELLGRSQEGPASFLVWFHLEGPDASAVLSPVHDDQPLVYGENLEIRTEACDDGRLRLTRIRSNLVELRQVACNVFRVDVNRQEAEFLRFEFHLPRILLDTGQSLAEFSEERGIGWVGQTQPDLVTSFVVNPTPTRPLSGFEDIDTIALPGGGGRIPVERR